jgi:hypothetical protein
MAQQIHISMSHKITFPTFGVFHWGLRPVDGPPPPARIAGFRQFRRQEIAMAQAQPVTLCVKAQATEQGHAGRGTYDLALKPL